MEHRIKKSIAILLSVLFLVSLTASAVSAGKKPSKECPPLIKEKDTKKLAELEVAKDKNPLLYTATVRAGNEWCPYCQKIVKV